MKILEVRFNRCYSEAENWVTKFDIRTAVFDNLRLQGGLLTQCRPTFDPAIDTFRVEFLVGPCFLLGLIFNYKFTFSEVLWSFSIFLESVAILPQLFLLQRTGEAETITTHYLAALGVYRALYIPNWIYRYVICYPVGELVTTCYDVLADAGQ